jgi:hypothetical protein
VRYRTTRDGGKLVKCKVGRTKKGCVHALITLVQTFGTGAPTAEEKKFDPCGATSCAGGSLCRGHHPGSGSSTFVTASGAGPEYSTHGAAFALTRCTTASDTVPNTTHPAVPDPPRHTTRREMRGPDSRDHEFRSPHCIFGIDRAEGRGSGRGGPAKRR